MPFSPSQCLLLLLTGHVCHATLQPQVLQAIVRFSNAVLLLPQLQVEDQKTAAIQATFAGADGSDGTLLAADSRGAVVICSDEGVITYSNQALSDLLGYKPNALNGNSISVLMPGPANIHHSSYMQHYKGTHHATKVDKGAQETIALSAGGYGVPVRLEVTTNTGGDSLTGTFEEVSLSSCLCSEFTHSRSGLHVRQHCSLAPLRHRARATKSS